MLWLTALVPIGVALADTPVLHDGPPEAAVARAVALGAGPAWELDPLRPEQLVRTTHAGLVGLESSCQRAPANAAELGKSVEFAETMFERQKWASATRHIAEAKAKLPCLVDEADAVRVAHLHMMEGIIALEHADEDAAMVAFDRAQRFGTDPTTRKTLAWNHRLASPDHGEHQLARAGANLLKAPVGTLRFAPGVDPGRIDLRIDGRTIPLAQTESLELPIGYHHIQVVSNSARGRVVRTYEVELTSEQPVVVADPTSLVGLSLVSHVQTPALSDFIRAAGIQGTTWVVAADQAWTYDTEWTRLPDVDLTAAATASQRSTRMRSAGVASIVTGAAISGVGLWGLSSVSRPPTWETSPERVAWRQGQYRAWVGTEVVGLLSMTTGVVLLWQGQTRR